MKMNMLLVLGVLVLAIAPFAVAAPISFDLVLQTNYQFGGCDSNGVCASPDTGFLTITNAGPTTYVGSLSLFNVGGSFLNNSIASITLSPGATVFLASGPEGSNQGGFGPNGLEFEAMGTFGGQSVDLTVFDSQIHSGVPRVSPCDGILTDAFVLQGGSPNGCDNGDGFETTQAPGNFSFVQTGTTPEPASLLLLGSGIIGAFGTIRRRLIG
jgi:hypothetical protein